MRCWASNTSTYITTDTLYIVSTDISHPYGVQTYQNTSSHANKCGFSSTASTRCQIAVVWVNRSAVDVALGLQVHDRLRLRSSRKKHTSLAIQRVVKNVGPMRLSNVCNKRSIGYNILAYHAVMLFGRNWQTKECTLWLRECIQLLGSGNSLVP